MTPCIKTLRKKIRFAEEPNNPQLICMWLKIEQVKMKNISYEKQWAGYINEANFLLDTLSDELIPAHWRECCLNHIHIPLGCLHRLVSSKKDLLRLNQLMYEVRETSKFFNPARAIR